MPRGVHKAKHPEVYQNLGPAQPRPSKLHSAKENYISDLESNLSRRLDETEAALLNGEVKVKILQSKIDAKTEELEAINRKLVARQATVDKEAERLDQQSQALKPKWEELKQALETAEDSYRVVKDKVKQGELELKKVLSELQERKLYQEEQESLIEQALEAGQDKLRDMNAEIKRFEDEREEVLAKLQENNLKVNHLESQLDLREGDMIKLEERYQDAAAEYRQELTNIKMEIAEAQTARDRTIAETDAKLLELKAERAELDIAREVILKQKEEASAEKRRLDSQRAMYGLQ